MDINTSNVRKLASLDDKEFSNVIYIIATALGMPPEKAKQASMNTAFFRSLLGNASDSDIKNLLGKVDQKQLESIYGKLPQQ